MLSGEIKHLWNLIPLYYIFILLIDGVVMWQEHPLVFFFLQCWHMCFFQCLYCSLRGLMTLYSLNLIIGELLYNHKTSIIQLVKSVWFKLDQNFIRKESQDGGLIFQLFVLWFCEWWSSWVNFTKFLTGASTVGGIAIPSILKHAGVIGWGAFAMELSSYFVFGLTIICYLWMSDEDEYSILWDEICFIVKMNLFLSCAIAFLALWLSLQHICF